MSGTDLIVAGFERAELDLQEYRQAWLMRPITREEMETPNPADEVARTFLRLYPSDVMVAEPAAAPPRTKKIEVAYLNEGESK